MRLLIPVGGISIAIGKKVIWCRNLSRKATLLGVFVAQETLTLKVGNKHVCSLMCLSDTRNNVKVLCDRYSLDFTTVWNKLTTEDFSHSIRRVIRNKSL